MDRGPHLGQQPLAQHPQEVEAGHPGRRFEIGEGSASKLQDRHCFVDDHADRREPVDDDPVRLALHVERAPERRLLFLRDPPARPLDRDVGREIERRAERRRLLPKQAILGVDGGEQVAVRADALGGPQKQEPVRIERVVQDRQHPLLERVVHVDQDVSATDEVETRERRIARQVVPRKHAQIADALADLVAAVDAHEEAAQSFRRDVDLDVVDVKAGASALESRLVDVGRQDLDRRRVGDAGKEFEKADRQRIDFLAAGAAGDPDADRQILRPAGDDGGEDPFLEHLERFRIAEELRDADQEVLKQIVKLAQVAAEQSDVRFDAVDSSKRHPALDPPFDRRPFVVGEVDLLAGPKQVEDLLNGIPLFERIDSQRRRHLRVGMIGQPHQILGDLLRRQDVIDRAVGDRAAGHAVVLGGPLLLGERDASFGLDRLKAERAVGPATRKNDADRLRTLHLRQRSKQVIGRHVRHSRHPTREPQMTVGEGERLDTHHCLPWDGPGLSQWVYGHKARRLWPWSRDFQKRRNASTTMRDQARRRPNGGNDHEILRPTAPILLRHRSPCEIDVPLRARSGRHDRLASEPRRSSRQLPASDRALQERSRRRLRVHVRLVLGRRSLRSAPDPLRPGARALPQGHSRRQGQERQDRCPQARPCAAARQLPGRLRLSARAARDFRDLLHAATASSVSAPCWSLTSRTPTASTTSRPRQEARLRRQSRGAERRGAFRRSQRAALSIETDLPLIDQFDERIHARAGIFSVMRRSTTPTSVPPAAVDSRRGQDPCPGVSSTRSTTSDVFPRSATSCRTAG